MKIWIDNSACEVDATFHLVDTVTMEVVHGDGSDCEECEFKIVEDGDDDN